MKQLRVAAMQPYLFALSDRSGLMLNTDKSSMRKTNKRYELRTQVWSYPAFTPRKSLTFSSVHGTTTDGYFLDSHLKNAGTPIFNKSLAFELMRT